MVCRGPPLCATNRGPSQNPHECLGHPRKRLLHFRQALTSWVCRRYCPPCRQPPLMGDPPTFTGKWPPPSGVRLVSPPGCPLEAVQRPLRSQRRAEREDPSSLRRPVAPPAPAPPARGAPSINDRASLLPPRSPMETVQRPSRSQRRDKRRYPCTAPPDPRASPHPRCLPPALPQPPPRFSDRCDGVGEQEQVRYF